MGDADSEIIVPVQDIESWMDDALGFVDEGLDHLILYMMNVNDRTKQIYTQLRNLEYLNRLLIAMNLLVVPVVISVLLCYSTRTTYDRYGLEVYYRLIVTVLMYLSSTLGLPLYFYSLWELYSVYKQIQKDSVTIRQSVPRTVSGRLDSTCLSEDSFVTFASNEASLERLNDLVRMLTDRMPGSMRTDIGRRRGSFRLADPNEVSPEMRIISLLFGNTANTSSEGMNVRNSSIIELEFQETKDDRSDSEEEATQDAVKNESNQFDVSKFGKVVDLESEKSPPEADSDQNVESDRNSEPNLKEKATPPTICDMGDKLLGPLNQEFCSL